MPTSKTEQKLHDEMLAMFQTIGRETGYWGRRFDQAVKRNGGLATAKRMLGKRLDNPNEQKGFQALVDCNAVYLSLEALVLEKRYSGLFTDVEMAEAQRRLDQVPEYAKPKDIPPEETFPDNLRDDETYQEGIRKKIVVNAYERNPKARAACLKKYGYSC